MMTQTTIRNFLECKARRLTIFKIDGIAQTVVLLPIKEMSYLVVGLFVDLEATLNICDINIFA